MFGQDTDEFLIFNSFYSWLVSLSPCVITHPGRCWRWTQTPGSQSGSSPIGESAPCSASSWTERRTHTHTDEWFLYLQLLLRGTITCLNKCRETRFKNWTNSFKAKKVEAPFTKKISISIFFFIKNIFHDDEINPKPSCWLFPSHVTEAVPRNITICGVTHVHTNTHSVGQRAAARGCV